MITKAQLVAFGLAASSLASGGRSHLSSRVLSAMADEALAAPLALGDDGVRLTMAVEVSLAWFEGSNQANPRGSNDGGASHCWGQIYLPGGARTKEGWTGAELRADPGKCAAVVVRIVKESVEKGPVDCPLCLYARGRVTPEARRLSKMRWELARKIAREVPLPQ